MGNIWSSSVPSLLIFWFVSINDFQAPLPYQIFELVVYVFVVRNLKNFVWDSDECDWYEIELCLVCRLGG